MTGGSEPATVPPNGTRVKASICAWVQPLGHKVSKWLKTPMVVIWVMLGAVTPPLYFWSK